MAVLEDKQYLQVCCQQYEYCTINNRGYYNK